MVNDSWPSVLRSLEISSLCAKRNCTKEVKLHVGNINADCNFIPPQWVKMSNSSVDPGRPLIAVSSLFVGKMEDWGSGDDIIIYRMSGIPFRGLD